MWRLGLAEKREIFYERWNIIEEEDGCSYLGGDSKRERGLGKG